MDPQEPRLFETLTLPNVAALCFVIRVADSKIKPELVPTPGTAYSACLLPTRIGVQEWGTYVYGFPQEAPAGYSAYVFLPALPTAPVVATRQDEIWGPVLDHSYYALRSAGIPDIADTNVSALGTPGNGRFVQRVQIQEVSSLVALLTVTTTAAATVTQTDKPVDPETGLLYTRTKTYTLAATTPPGAALNTTGNFTSVTQPSHRLFISVTDKVTTLPGPLSPITWFGTEVYNWPKVLQGAYLQNIYDSEDNATRRVAKGVFAFPAKEAYRGACLAKYEDWWQQTAPTVPVPVQMIDVGISIGGVYERIDIEPCLHQAINYFEQNFGGRDDRYENFSLRWTYAPTNYTDWPPFVFFLDVQRMGGGFRCKRTTIYRPSVGTSGQLRFSFSS